MADYLTEEMVAEVKEAFELFFAADSLGVTALSPPFKPGSVLLPVSEVPKVLRVLALAPANEAQLAELVAKADPQGSGGIEFDDFVILVGRLVRDLGRLEVARQAFRVFDTTGKPGGELSHAELRHVLTGLPGDKVAMTDEEFDVFIADTVAAAGFTQLPELTGSATGKAGPVANPEDGVIHTDIFTEFMRKFDKEKG